MLYSLMRLCLWCQSKWDADHPGNGTLEVFDELLFRHVMTLASQPNPCPGIAIHIQGELSDIYWDRPIPAGSLLMSKFIRSSFAEGVVRATANPNPKSIIYL